ncbi:MAG: hypothetical protein AAFO57_00125 [Pseudomonadota bacterium]
MTMINVQFTDSKQTAICAYFGAPQDLTAYPNQGTIDTSDARYAAYCNSLPAQFRQALPAPV